MMTRQLVLALTLVACKSETRAPEADSIHEATCTEIAELAAAACERRTSIRCDQRFADYRVACASEARAGRSLCIDDPRSGGGRRCVPPRGAS